MTCGWLTRGRQQNLGFKDFRFSKITIVSIGTELHGNLPLSRIASERYVTSGAQILTGYVIKLFLML